MLPSTAAETDNFESFMSIINGILLTGSYSNVVPERYAATYFEDQLELKRDKLSFNLLAHAGDRRIAVISFPKHPFMIGVQWHPECNYEKDKLSQFLFSQFIYHAKKISVNLVSLTRRLFIKFCIRF